MFRTFFQGLFGIFIILLGVILVLATIVASCLFNPGYYSNALEASNLYENLPELLSDFAVSNIEQMSEEIPPGLSTAITRAIEGDVTPALIENVIENNIQNIISYLKSETSELMIYIPKQELKEMYKQATKALMVEVGNETPAGINIGFTEDMPLCTPIQLEQLMKNAEKEGFNPSSITCIPDFFSMAGSQGEGSFDIDKLFEGENNILLSELETMLGQDFNLEQNFDSLVDQIQVGAKIAMNGLILLWIIWLVFILIYLLLSKGIVLQRIKALVYPGAVMGVILLLMGLFSSSLSNLAFAQLQRAADPLAEDLLAQGIVLADLLISGVFNLILVAGIVIVIVSGSTWIATYYLLSQNRTLNPE